MIKGNIHQFLMHFEVKQKFITNNIQLSRGKNKHTIIFNINKRDL